MRYCGISKVDMAGIAATRKYDQPTFAIRSGKRDLIPCPLRRDWPSPPTEMASTGDYATRLQALRAELAKHGQHGFLVPMADEYLLQSEEQAGLGAAASRFFFGFAGSAGFIAPARRQGGVFHRWAPYTLQAGQQIPA